MSELSYVNFRPAMGRDVRTIGVQTRLATARIEVAADVQATRTEVAAFVARRGSHNIAAGDRR